ncbi:P-loop containing nucleoside triphosphate hydrolase protein [Mycena pura]|uniref:DNA 3'-5' helicase n=1 Tax=Mycena pura TaxID=153505 RepID=A0AAD7E2C5_9AGAR|nr:P-loop containing nucleoside triphosphate hydrolase protein [Mycena pura]
MCVPTHGFLPVLFIVFLLISHNCLASKFYSALGFKLAREILLEVLPHFDPHHYQINGICKVLNGVDLVAVTPTGSGKTAYLFLPILVMIAILKSPALCPAVKFPKDPAIVVVCPTNSIKQQMDENMAKFGLAAVTINSKTAAAARLRGEDLWIKARAGIPMLILGLEQLISKGFRDLLAFEPFYDRVCALGVDEIHLLQISFMGEFHLIRCSNARHVIQFLFQRLHSGIDGRMFPKIAWVLNNHDKTLIFGTSTSLVHRLKAYLNGLLAVNLDHDFCIRTHTRLDWPDDKAQTLTDITNNLACQIIIATNGLAQGNDIRVIKTMIQIGEPESVEMYVQKPGRARPCVQDPHAIFYISSNGMDLAAKIIGQTDAETMQMRKKWGVILSYLAQAIRLLAPSHGKPPNSGCTMASHGESVPRMTCATAEILTVECKPTEQDRQFNNPPLDSCCPCKACTESPPAPWPELCRCSGCMLKTASHELYVLLPPKKKAASDIPQGKRLTKIMKEVGRTRRTRPKEDRLSVWMEAPDHSTGLTPLAEFLPNIIISQILDCFAKIEVVSELSPFISQLTGMEGYHEVLFEILVGLREKFKKMKKSGTKK